MHWQDRYASCYGFRRPYVTDVIYRSKDGRTTNIADDAHTPTIETELTYDYTYSQLPPIDYWTQ
jgi:hypothetical protein